MNSTREWMKDMVEEQRRYLLQHHLIQLRPNSGHVIDCLALALNYRDIALINKDVCWVDAFDRLAGHYEKLFDDADPPATAQWPAASIIDIVDTGIAPSPTTLVEYAISDVQHEVEDSDDLGSAYARLLEKCAEREREHRHFSNPDFLTIGIGRWRQDPRQPFEQVQKWARSQSKWWDNNATRVLTPKSKDYRKARLWVRWYNRVGSYYLRARTRNDVDVFKRSYVWPTEFMLFALETMRSAPGREFVPDFQVRRFYAAKKRVTTGMDMWARLPEAFAPGCMPQGTDYDGFWKAAEVASKDARIATPSFVKHSRLLRPGEGQYECTFGD